VFWVISGYFNIRNTLPKSGTFLLGHPVYSQIKSTCNKDGEVNIFTHLPGVCGKKKKRAHKYEKYLNKTAWSYPREDGKVNTHTPLLFRSRSSALNG